MKAFGILLSIVVVSLAPLCYAEGDPKFRDFQGWVDFVKKDAKVDALVKLLGKPDEVEEDGRLYLWHGARDDGTKRGNILFVFVREVNGTKVVVGLAKGRFPEDKVTFPWSNSAR